MKEKLKIVAVLVTAFLILPTEIYAQKDSIKHEDRVKNLVSVEEGIHRTKVTFPGGDIEVNELGDTLTRITIGRRRYDIIERNGDHTRIQMVKNPRENFKGHWTGFDLGLNNFFSSPFESELSPESRWMDLNNSKSVAVGMNLLQYNIGLLKHRNNFGLFTGAGWTINNYRLDSKNIIRRGDDGKTTYSVTNRNVEKNKLVTSYLTIPVLLELQLPSSGDDSDFFISGGIYGSMQLGSHTKVVFSDGGGREKEKWRENLNLNAVKYGAMVRVGYKWLRLFGKCDLSPMFEPDEGPELYPWTIGLTLLQL